ncbi:hypothetical protein BC831DRAFT_551102 [Entophlyctis helioformis]|nr:hypothetical protein BC831DRAFT_551102 [Entophlyctis helioformis]
MTWSPELGAAALALSMAALALLLYLATTTHARFRPVRHSFKYSLFYLGFDIDALDAAEPARLPSWLFAHNRSALVSLWDADYLSPTIRSKLTAHLVAFGYSPADIGRVELVTVPRIFGHAFNPLSVYYVHKPVSTDPSAGPSSTDPSAAKGISDSLLLVLLEVNNTFSERHIYLCNPHTRLPNTKPGYTGSFSTNRSFHVSPFNNRTGTYEADIVDTDMGKLDVLINVKDYIDTTTTTTASSDEPLNSNDAKGPKESTMQPASKAHIHLMARLYGTSQPLTTGALLWTLAAFPLTAFLTVPRIMYEAMRLAYSKGLPVYQRPTPYAGKQDAGQTIVRKLPDAFQRVCQDIVIHHLTARAAHTGTSLRLVFPDNSYTLIGSSSPSTTKTPPPSLYISSYNAFIRLVVYAQRPLVGLFLAFTTGDAYASRADLGAILALLGASPLTSQQQVARAHVAAYLAGQLPSDAGELETHNRRYYHAGRVDAKHGVGAAAVATVCDDNNNDRDGKCELAPIDVAADPSWPAALASGLYLYRLEEGWFKTITKFVDNGEPWRVAVRAHDHAAKVSQSLTAAAADALTEMDELDELDRDVRDEVGLLERERRRATHFIACASHALSF